MPAPIFWAPPHTLQAKQRLPQLTATLEQRLQQIAQRFRRIKLASSLAAEDMVLTDAIARLQLPIRIITLQTGKLNIETLALLPQTETRYGLKIQTFAPDAETAAAFEAEHGAGAMYAGVDLRRECCRIRKIEPLNRALADADAWLTGQRREQSATRDALMPEETDTARGLAKFNPLFDWQEADIWAYAEAHQLPINPLYHQGYPSIGCEPCSRPVKAGENLRAGRWWWENADSKECGLHK